MKFSINELRLIKSALVLILRTIKPLDFESYNKIEKLKNKIYEEIKRVEND